MYLLRRSSGDELALHREHRAIAKPRRGEIDWASFDPSIYDAAALDAAARLWAHRALQETHSLALFTELLGHLHVLGAPLDWSGAFARMIADEVRHADLCLGMCEALGRPASVAIEPEALHLLPEGATEAHVRETIVAAFCIGETLSGRMFRRALRATDVPLARAVVAAIVRDEGFHGELGWELGALLMREPEGPRAAGWADERAALAARLPSLFAHFAELCHAERGEAWARATPTTDDGPNFGTMSHAGYARAFFDGMTADVVPGLVAIGLPEAESAWAEVRKKLG